MSSSAGGMLSKEEESNAEVRREDQENINKFGRLNARMQEIQEERAVLKVCKREEQKAKHKTKQKPLPCSYYHMYDIIWKQLLYYLPSHTHTHIVHFF
jgi:hypothetical protein